MVDDGIEVAEYLRKHLRKDKIIIVGHSWGSLIGAHMAQRRPDLFAAYVGTGQLTNLEDDGRDLFEQALARARRESNRAAIDALEAVAELPPVDVHRMDVVRLWGRTEDISDNPLMLYLGPLLSPGYPIRDALSLRQGIAKSRAELFEQELRADLVRDVPELQVAAFLFQGRDDWQVSTPAALRYFEGLHAPVKQVVLFEGGHFVPVLHSEEFLQALVDKVRPLAVR
jgi:pimeloyl-ACP methyl ester carboxylesterase